MIKFLTEMVLELGCLNYLVSFIRKQGENGDYGKDIIWRANRIEVDPGKTYIVRLYGHNNSPKGYDAIAKNTQVQFMVPEEFGRTLVVFGRLGHQTLIQIDTGTVWCLQVRISSTWSL